MIFCVVAIAFEIYFQWSLKSLVYLFNFEEDIFDSFW